MIKKFQSFQEFWPFYLSQHLNPTCRRLHFAGLALGIFILLIKIEWIPIALLVGYGLAWIGHFGFEKNRAATFQYVGWSFRGDFKMFWLILTRKLGAEFKRLHLDSVAAHSKIRRENS